MIVISYSLRHFNPNNPDFVWGSAGQIAKEIYQAAKSVVGEDQILMVDAIDTTSWISLQKNVDVLITIECHAIAAKKFYNPKRTLFISVNQHPKFRKKLFKEALDAGFPKESLSSSDGIFEAAEGMKVADKILQIGDFESIKSYLVQGIKLRDIYSVAYKPKYHNWVFDSKRIDILCHLGSLGYRKGLDLILSFAEELQKSKSSRRIHVTGTPVNSFWEGKCKDAEIRFPQNIVFHGWVQPESVDFLRLLNSCRMAVFPTREEGMSGAYLETALSGIPTITTKFVGIETVPNLTMSKPDLESLMNCYRLAEGDFEVMLESANFTKKMYESINFFSNQIENAVARFIQTNCVWPEINIVLPVHNKEKSISRLLKMLAESAFQVDNVNLTLIDDGSHDKSFEALESFARGRKSQKIFREIRLLKTLDIFEVKSNNLGIQQFDSDFHLIVQDDNFIYQPTLIAEMLSFASRYQNIAALGGLAGVNFYPIVESCAEHTPGQHSVTENEHYWRQDKDTDLTLGEKYFQVDAVMRGPLLMSASAIKEIGLLDERYAPLYSDDMAWCFKARNLGFEIVAITGGVLNQSETMSTPTETQNVIYSNAFAKNTELFYREWKPGPDKPYLSFNRKNWNSIGSNLFSLKKQRYLAFPINKKTLRVYILMNHPAVAKAFRLIKKSLKPRG